MYIVYKDKAGEYRWQFVSNGNKIADSGEGYINKADCLNGIRLMKESADAEVFDETLAVSSL
jgi:uncharacterized protein